MTSPGELLAGLWAGRRWGLVDVAAEVDIVAVGAAVGAAAGIVVVVGTAVDTVAGIPARRHHGLDMALGMLVVDRDEAWGPSCRGAVVRRPGRQTSTLVGPSCARLDRRRSRGRGSDRTRRLHATGNGAVVGNCRLESRE